VAIKAKLPIHLEIQRRYSQAPVGLLRSTFRDPADGKIKHTSHGRLCGLPLETLLNVQAALQSKAVPAGHPDAVRLLRSREHGASAALLALARDIGLDTALHSKPFTQNWIAPTLAMVAGRVLYQGSKLALSRQGQSTALWELAGVKGPVDVDKHCYQPLDELLSRQTHIQKALAKRHLRNGCLVLYDITSTYFEGAYQSSELVQFGYNRDGKRGHEQVVIGLLTSPDGCPVAVEVFPGNTQDASTVEAKVRELRQTYGIKEVVLVGDRGMITSAVEEKLSALPDAEGLKIISALTHRQMVDLLQRTGRQPELFDDTHIVEIVDPANPGTRYCLCRNPDGAAREGATRQALLDRTREALDRIAARKKKADPEKLGEQVGRILEKTRMGKFVKRSVVDGRLVWNFDTELIAAEKAFDGCYVIRTTVATEHLATDDVVARYKSLTQVEQAFRHLKTVSLELRPVYHKKDHRIRAHAFLCMLSYHLLWHAKKRLAPLLNGDPGPDGWTLDLVWDSLKSLRQQRVSVAGAEFDQLTEPTDEQTLLLKHLGVTLRSPGH
jgi:Transposase DDE domain